MKLSDKLIYQVGKRELKKNSKYKNAHKGESCYIFGNGVSLKNMELERFNDKISIGCNSLFTHKDFYKLNCKYYLIPPSILFYPYRKFYGRLQKNYLGLLYREKINQFVDTQFFISLTNCFNMRGNNISYIHHFGSKQWQPGQYEMDGAFSFMEGATHAMLGAAMYMGFSSAVLVGVDYTFSPRRLKHFFETGPGKIADTTENQDYAGELFQACGEKLKMSTITLDGDKSDLLDYEGYSAYTGQNMQYKENSEIVDAHSLECLNKLGFYDIY